MTILYIGNTLHPLSANLANKINIQTGIRIDAILASDKSRNNFQYIESYRKGHQYKIINTKLNLLKINGIFNILSLIVCLLKRRKYDIIHIQYIHPEHCFLIPFIKSKSNHFVSTVWGSDIMKPKRHIGCIRKVINSSDITTCTNEHYKDRILSISKCSPQKIKVLPFVLNVLREISELDHYSKEEIKIQMNIPSDHLVICCGTNPRKMQHHLEIIIEILKISKKLLKPIFLLFPMSYGEQLKDYIDEIDEEMRKTNLPYLKLIDYMSDTEVARLRIVSDILIQVQDHDQLSGAMIETIYSGNIVITGSWLPYSILEDHDIFYYKVDAINEIHGYLLECVNNYDTHKNGAINNRERIEIITENKEVINKWEVNYSELMKGSINA